MQRIIPLIILVIAVAAIAISNNTSKNALQQTQSFRIENINSRDITFNGKKCRKGDTITDLGQIGWNSEKDAMQVRVLKSREIITLRAKESRQYGGVGLWETYMTSTRGVRDPEMLAEELDTIAIFDKWRKYVGFPTDDICHFVLKYTDRRGVRDIHIKGDKKNDLYIDRRYFDDAYTDTIDCRLEYIDENNDVLLISPKVTIILLEGI